MASAGSDCDIAEAWHHGGVSNSLRKGKKRPRGTRTLSIFWTALFLIRRSGDSRRSALRTLLPQPTSRADNRTGGPAS
jgi:hypothetical protein